MNSRISPAISRSLFSCALASISGVCRAASSLPHLLSAKWGKFAAIAARSAGLRVVLDQSDPGGYRPAHPSA